MKKFELTGETRTIVHLSETVTLHRIRAVAEFDFVEAGDLGGWIEKEENLSHEGNAWVYGNAEVYEGARVYGNAGVCGDARVYGNARVYKGAWVSGDAEVHGNARVYENAWVSGDAEVSASARVCSNARVFLTNHVLVVGAIGSRNDFTTFYRGKRKQIMVECESYNNTMEEFLKRVAKTHGNSRHALVYRAAAEIAKLQIDLSADTQEEEGECVFD